VATPTPQATGRLIAVCPDVAELLAVVEVPKITLHSTHFHPDCSVAKALSLKMYYDFDLTGNTLRLRYRDRLMLYNEEITVWYENRREQKCTLWAECKVIFFRSRLSV
jgi:hypothetical protein